MVPAVAVGKGEHSSSRVGSQEILHRRRILQQVGAKFQDLMLMKVHALVQAVSRGFYMCD